MTRLKALLLLAVLALALVPLAAFAQDNPDYVVVPGPGESLDDSTGYFVIDARLGQRFDESLLLRNDDDAAIVVSLAAVDAETGVLGGVSYGIETEKTDAVGSWIDISRKKVRLGPGSSARVPFTVDVPNDARPGVNLGGISAYIPGTEQAQGANEEQGEDQAGASIVVRTRRILAVQVNLPGPNQPELVVSGIEPAARPDGLYLEIQIANQGHGLTKGTGVVELPDEGFEQQFSLDTFVPGTTIAYPVKWTDAADNGDYEARVRIDYDGGRTATWDGTFTLGQEVQEELADRQVAPPEAAEGSSGPGMTVIAIGALVLGMGVMYVVMRRRSPRSSD